MKALLTIPLYKYFLKFPNFQQMAVDALGKTDIYPPLGLHYIASYANKYTNHEVKVLDPFAFNLDYEGMKKEIKKYDPDVVGITALTNQYRDVIETAKITKEVNPNIHVCVGGAHAYIYPDEIMKCISIDSVILGEAEYSFAGLLNLIERNDNSDETDIDKNVIIINNGKRDLPVIKDLDLLPFPDRTKMPLEKYRSTFGKKELLTSIIGNRGCPFRCAFCFHLFGQNCRARSTANIVEELKECVDLGIHKITFWDDTLTINSKWVIDLCDKIIKEKMDLSWECRGRVNTVNKKVLEKLYKAGCDRIHYGVESGVERMLKVMQKDITLEQVRKAIKISKEIGFTTFTTWMIGLPSETVQEINQTIEFVCSIKGLDFANFSAFYPLPNTKFYDMGLKKGLFNDYWKEYTINPTDNFKLRAWDYDISFSTIMLKVNECFQKFYMRPTKVFDILKTCETLSDLKVYTKAGWWFLKEKLM